MWLTLSSVNLTGWILIIHDLNNIVFANTKIYGSDELSLEINALSAGFYRYEVVPTGRPLLPRKMTHVSLLRTWNKRKYFIASKATKIPY